MGKPPDVDVSRSIQRWTRSPLYEINIEPCNLGSHRIFFLRGENSYNSCVLVDGDVEHGWRSYPDFRSTGENYVPRIL